MADELQLQQIVSNPTYKKVNGEKSFLDRIYTNLDIKDEVRHYDSSKTDHDIIKVSFEVLVNKEEDDDQKEEEKKLNTKYVEYSKVNDENKALNLSETTEKLAPSQAVAKLTEELMKSLMNNGAKLKPKTTVKDIREDPEVQNEIRKARRLTKKLTTRKRGEGREAIIDELKTVLDTITDLKEKKAEDQERKIFEGAPKKLKGSL